MVGEPEVAVTLRLYNEHGKQIKSGRSILESILDIRNGKKESFSSFFSGGKNRNFLIDRLVEELLEVFNNAMSSVVGKARGVNGNPAEINAEYNRIINLRENVSDLARSLINSTEKIARDRRNSANGYGQSISDVNKKVLSPDVINIDGSNISSTNQRPNTQLGETREIENRRWKSQKQHMKDMLSSTFGKKLNVGLLNQNSLTKSQFSSTWGEGLSVGSNPRGFLFKELGGVRYQLFKTGKSFKAWREDLGAFYKDATKSMFGNMFKGGGIFGMIGKMFGGPWGWLALLAEIIIKIGKVIKDLIKAYAQFASQFAKNALFKSIKMMFKPAKLVFKTLISLLKTALSRSQIFQSFIQSSIIPFIVLLEYIFLPVIKTLLPFVTQFVKIISDHKNDIIAFGTILADWLKGFLEPLLEVFKNGSFFNNPIEAVANAVAQGFTKITDWILSHKTELIKIGVDMAKAIAVMLKSSFELVQIIAATLRNIILEAAQSDEVKSLVDTFKEVVITIMSSINDILLDPKVNSMISDLVLNLLGIFISTFLSAMSTMPVFGPIFGTMADIWNSTQKRGDKYIGDEGRYNYWMRQIDPGAYTTPKGNTIGDTFNNTSTVTQQFNVGLASTSFTAGTSDASKFPLFGGYNGIGSSSL